MTPEEIALQQFPQPDARGWLVFRQLPDDLRRLEDMTYAADSHRLQHEFLHRDLWDRPATETERYLLACLGYEVPEDLTTRVEYRTASLRHRSWPQLEQLEESSA